MANKEIRARLERARKEAGIFTYQVAYYLGVNDVTFSRWLRRELPAERQAQVIEAINKLSEGGCKANG